MIFIIIWTVWWKQPSLIRNTEAGLLLAQSHGFRSCWWHQVSVQRQHDFAVPPSGSGIQKDFPPPYWDTSLDCITIWSRWPLYQECWAINNNSVVHKGLPVSAEAMRPTACLHTLKCFIWWQNLAEMNFNGCNDYHIQNLLKISNDDEKCGNIR